MTSFHSQLQQKAQDLLEQSDIRTRDLVALLQSIEVSDAEIQSLMCEDLAHPYGRKVILNHDNLEIMVATWTRGVPCAPHDHHDSRSAIRVLQGRSHHKMFRCHEGHLIETLSEYKSKGDVLLCPPRQIHAMGDDAAEKSLVTLHAYSGSIDNMVVYSADETLIVSGSCGAWVPESDADIYGRATGHVLREAVSYSSGI